MDEDLLADWPREVEAHVRMLLPDTMAEDEAVLRSALVDLAKSRGYTVPDGAVVSVERPVMYGEGEPTNYVHGVLRFKA